MVHPDLHILQEAVLVAKVSLGTGQKPGQVQAYQHHLLRFRLQLPVKVFAGNLKANYSTGPVCLESKKKQEVVEVEEDILTYLWRQLDLEIDAKETNLDILDKISCRLANHVPESYPDTAWGPRASMIFCFLNHDYVRYRIQSD